MSKNAQAVFAERGKYVSDLFFKFVNEVLTRFSVAEQHCQRAAIRVLPQLFALTLVSEIVADVPNPFERYANLLCWRMK